MFTLDDRTLADSWRTAAFWETATSLGRPVAVYVPHGAEAIGQIARRHPGLRLLVDHAALDVFPDSRLAQRFDGWDALPGLIPCENVWIKISGLPDAVDEPYPFPSAQKRLRELRDWFGAERLIWGSNFPPLLRVASYRESLDYVRNGCSFLSDAERELILGGTVLQVIER
jgi:L-fuconolactonase